jgi:hypothetical protein
VDVGDAERIEEASPVREHVLDGELVAVGRRFRPPEAATVHADDAVFGGEDGDPFVVQVEVAVAEVVEEDDLRRLPGVGVVVVLVVKVGAVDLDRRNPNAACF